MFDISVSVDGDFDEGSVEKDADKSLGVAENDSTSGCGGEVGGGGTVGGDEGGAGTDD